MINVNADVSGVGQSIISRLGSDAPLKNAKQAGKTSFTKFVEKYVSEVDDLQQESNTAIKDLLSGKHQDITSVVAAFAKADMSFKLLVNVRNKIIEAYKQTMNMSI